MHEPQHLALGEFATGTSDYAGHHRFGVALIPHGDRHRADYEFIAEDNGSTGVYEERDSLDQYSKYV